MHVNTELLVPRPPRLMYIICEHLLTTFTVYMKLAQAVPMQLHMTHPPMSLILYVYLTSGLFYIAAALTVIGHSFGIIV